MKPTLTLKGCVMNLLILSAGVVTAYGSFLHEPISVDAARQLVAVHDGRVTSAIGHAGTARLLAELLGSFVSVNRIQVEQQVDQVALIFRPSVRIAEGAVLTDAELRQAAMSLSTLTRTA